MSLPFRAKPAAETLPLTLLTKQALPGWLTRAGAVRRAWVQGSGFKAAAGELCLLPGRDGAPAGALVGIAGDGGPDDLWTAAGLSGRLPEGSWRFDPEPAGPEATRLALGWALGAYSFTRYKQPGRAAAELVWPARADRGYVERAARAAALVRDLVNTPAEDMGPAELAKAAAAMARRLGMTTRVIEGEALLEKNFPLIHAVGRASQRAPRLIDLAWGKAAHPKVTLVGKGVCFDTGGLDIKSDAGMKLMKKDMGGAAHALGLAQMIVEAKLPVRLRVLVPAVENAVAGNALRPLDVVKSRKGLTVEIGNTDAEGRLILADALTEASRDKPALLVDFATLTGAARVALGPELPALFCNDDALADELARHAAAEADPLWRLPLWQPYRKRLDSKVADLNNIAEGGFAGSIYAALFMQDFIEPGIPWLHFDLFAWNPYARPGRPEGAEAQVIRAVYALIAARFGGKREAPSASN
ncbi:MAG TPA: leucyl aminopeptidase family protein [Alphaproteobacteria bacterium]|nr:leucyl aminopeptidase family protein [Alphaproteobacteria bacterium]